MVETGICSNRCNSTIIHPTIPVADVGWFASGYSGLSLESHRDLNRHATISDNNKVGVGGVVLDHCSIARYIGRELSVRR